MKNIIKKNMKDKSFSQLRIVFTCINLIRGGGGGGRLREEY